MSHYWYCSLLEFKSFLFFQFCSSKTETEWSLPHLITAIEATCYQKLFTVRASYFFPFIASCQPALCTWLQICDFFLSFSFPNRRSPSRRMLMHLFLRDRLAEPCDIPRRQHQPQTLVTTPAGGPPTSRGVRLISSHFVCSLRALMRFPGKMSI